MEAGVKIAAASSVVLAGILVALLFRHDGVEAPADVPGNGDRLVLGNRLPPPAGWDRNIPRRRQGRPESDRRRGREEFPISASAAAGAPGQKATILTPKDPGQPPPPLARDYPGTDVPEGSGWGTSIELPPVTRRNDPAQTHRIVDGDTLRTLAERYLGSADRCLEIYDANRDVLPSPELLPIGVELKIPPL